MQSRLIAAKDSSIKIHLLIILKLQPWRKFVKTHLVFLVDEEWNTHIGSILEEHRCPVTREATTDPWLIRMVQLL